MGKLNSFWTDSRGNLNIFTVIAVFAGATVIGLPWAMVLTKYPHPEQLETSLLCNFLLVVVPSVTDGSLAMIMEWGFWKARKAPDAVNLQTGEGATNNQKIEPETQEA